MITLNVCYSRTTRQPHRKRRFEHRNVTNIKILGYSDISNGPDIRAVLNVHPRKPEGPGWSVSGFAWIKDKDDQRRAAPRRRHASITEGSDAP
jgi:hypothetical protein